MVHFRRRIGYLLVVMGLGEAKEVANLILSNSICPSLTLKDPACCNTTVALYKLPDPQPPASLSALISLFCCSFPLFLSLPPV